MIDAAHSICIIQHTACSYLLTYLELSTYLHYAFFLLMYYENELYLPLTSLTGTYLRR